MKKLLFLVFLTCLSANLLAQGTTEDYKRAFEQRAKYSGKVYYDNVQPNWIGDTHCFWYVRNTPDGRIYVIVDANKQKRTELFNHEKLAKALTEALNNYFAQHEYITVRNYAMLCRCSLSTARRHIAEMLADGRLAKSGITKGLYKRNG